jgi:4-hydroxy-tetrahydrodipicolinate synthase
MATLKGVIAPATTPFDGDDRIHLQAVRRQTDWLIANGVHGIAAGGSTGEGHTLDADEFVALIGATVEAAAGRVPVIAGVITDSTRDALRRGKAVAGLGVAALQVTPVHYLFRPDDDSMLQHFRTLAEETGLPVIIYNVVPWSYLSPALLLRIMREVAGVVGVKQSAGDLKLFADLMLDARPQDLIFSAVDALLYSSYALGARGSIAAILTAAPRASVDLWDAVQAADHGRAKALHERLLRLWNAIAADNLPACVKYAQALHGCPVGRPRAPMPPATETQQLAIRDALAGLGITIVAAA